MEVWSSVSSESLKVHGLKLLYKTEQHFLCRRPSLLWCKAWQTQLLGWNTEVAAVRDHLVNSNFAYDLVWSKAFPKWLSTEELHENSTKCIHVTLFIYCFCCELFRSLESWCPSTHCTTSKLASCSDELWQSKISKICMESHVFNLYREFQACNDSNRSHKIRYSPECWLV